jgi:hypothetical protein
MKKKIARGDRPRRWRAHRHCTNGRAVSSITWSVVTVRSAVLQVERGRMITVCAVGLSNILSI